MKNAVVAATTVSLVRFTPSVPPMDHLPRIELPELIHGQRIAILPRTASDFILKLEGSLLRFGLTDIDSHLY
jgi:hypothetical protein